mgnify:FL=1
MRTRTGWNGARFPPRSFSPYTGCVLGISGPEFLVIVLVAVIVIGPQRLPEYTRRLTQAVRRLRVFLDDTKEQIAEEVGPELADLNLSDLDPRNYDPRKIVRDALGEDLDAIRRDLATPFQSTVRTAKDATDEAVGTFNAQARSRSKKLTRMIDDKAHEAHSASAPSDVPGEETGAPGPAGPAPVDGAQSTDVGRSVIPADGASSEPAPVPSSLTGDEPAGTSGGPGAPAGRPISPREIVRAANAAARTRAGAATAVLDV